VTGIENLAIEISLLISTISRDASSERRNKFRPLRLQS
jgi:hypothetical protein